VQSNVLEEPVASVFGVEVSRAGFSSAIQGLSHWPILASMNSTVCMVLQDLFFLWACTKEPASALVLPSFPYVQANLVYIFLLCH
jgi:hypothetical protein